MFEANTAIDAVRLSRSDDPGKAELGSLGRAGMKIVKARPLGGHDILVQGRVGVAELVPGDAGLRVIAVGRDLHRGPRAMLVKPTQAADELFLETIPPETQVIGLDRVDPELGHLASLDPLGPGIAEQAVREQAKLIRRLARSDLDPHALGAEAGLLKRNLVSA